jgi:plastocyanin
MPGMKRPSVILLIALSAPVACSSGGTGTGSTAPDTGAGDGGVTLNNCTAFIDATAAGASRKIVWDLTVASSPTRCMTVGKGQTIAFEGDFVMHPLVASGGDTPNPFASVPDTGKVTFTATGTFGFICSVHSNMTGVIRVTE